MMTILVFKLQNSSVTNLDTKMEPLRECLLSLRKSHKVKDILVLCVGLWRYCSSTAQEQVLEYQFFYAELAYGSQCMA